MQRMSTMMHPLLRPLLLGTFFWGLLSNRSPAETVFLEAETLQPSSAGWVVTNNDQTQRASRTRTLWGADGPGDAAATRTVRVRDAGRYRVWVAIPARRSVARSL